MSDAYDRQEVEKLWSGEFGNPYDGDELEPIEDGQDVMAKLITDSFFQATLEDAFRAQERLRATRDSRALAASNANSRMLLEVLKGHV